MRMRRVQPFALIALVFSALVFSHPALAQFSQQGPKLVGTGDRGDTFQGSSASLSNDGNTAVLGGLNNKSQAGATKVLASDPRGVWTSGGPYGGNISALAIGPMTPSTLYAGTEGGVFKSVDSGITWAAALWQDYVQALAINPANPATLYAGSVYGGVLKSTDSGGTWTAVNTGLTDQDVLALAINPANPATLYAGTYYGGVFKSTNSGGTWTPTNTGLTNLTVQVLAINPANPATLYAGTNGGGVFKSTNSGGTWAAANTGLPESYILALAINPATPSIIYSGTFDGVFKSTDSGSTWVHTGLTVLYGFALMIDPTNPATLYAGTNLSGVFKSTDSGGTWANTGLQEQWVRALAINPTNPATLYAGTSGYGVFRSTDSGGNWSDANKGLTALWIDSLAINPANPATLYAGGSYGSGVFKSTNSGANWAPANAGLPYLYVKALAINPASPATLYAGLDGVFKSTDSGATWCNTGELNGYVNVLAINPVNTSTLYAGTNGDGVFKSTDSGGTWVNTGLRDLWVFALVINPMTPATLYSGTFGGGVFKSTNSGGTWAATNTGLPDLYVRTMAIDPITPSTLYAGTDAGVFKSTNSSGTWAAANTGLPNLHVRALAINPATPATLYVGMSGNGVFKSTDSGGTWAATNPGLPNLWVGAMTLDPTGATTLYAGLLHGSVWQMTMGTGCTLSCTAYATPTTGQAPLAVNFTATATPSNCTGTVTCAWVFGDGDSSTRQNPSHTYTAAGTYNWTLMMTVDGQTCAQSGTITVLAPPACTLSCTASAVPSAGTAPLAVTFAATATPSNCTGSPSFSWSFGDGTSSSEQNPSKTYSSDGTYAWSLTAAMDGQTCAQSGTIIVSPGDTITLSGHAFLKGQIPIKGTGGDKIVARDSGGAEVGSAAIGADGAYSLDLQKGSYSLECDIWYAESTGNHGDLRAAKVSRPLQSYSASQTVDFVFPSPIVMVHGIKSGPDKWANWISWMNTTHPGVIVFTPTYNDQASYDDEALSVYQGLEWDFSHLSAAAPDFAVVAHSKGGLVARVFKNRYQGQALGDALKDVIMLGTPNNGSDLGLGIGCAGILSGCDCFSLCKCEIIGDGPGNALNQVYPDFPGLSGHVHAIAGTNSTWALPGLVWGGIFEVCGSLSEHQTMGTSDVPESLALSGPNDGAVEVDSALTIEASGHSPPKVFFPGFVVDAGHAELGCASTLGLLSEVILPYLLDGKPFPICPSIYVSDYAACTADTPTYTGACISGRGYDVWTGQCGVTLPTIGSSSVSINWQAPSGSLELDPPSMVNAVSTISTGGCGSYGLANTMRRVTSERAHRAKGHGEASVSTTPTLLGYYIYRDQRTPVPTNADNRVGSVTVNQTSFVDNWPLMGTNYYVATAVYDQGESGPSNTVSAGGSKPGDCNGDGQVSIGEVQKAINMFLGSQAVGCGADCNGDSQISIGEVQKVINAFLGMQSSC